MKPTQVNLSWVTRETVQTYTPDPVEKILLAKLLDVNALKKKVERVSPTLFMYKPSHAYFEFVSKIHSIHKQNKTK